MVREIELTRGHKAIVDDEWYEMLSCVKWHAGVTKEGVYARCAVVKNGKQSTESMHRVIKKPPHGFIVDHRNRNTLDYREENLRICRRKHNLRNRVASTGFTSRHKGVCWCPQYRKWRAYIAADGKRVWLGRFDAEDDAARAYNEAAKELHGEFALLNEV